VRERTGVGAGKSMASEVEEKLPIPCITESYDRALLKNEPRAHDRGRAEERPFRGPRKTYGIPAAFRPLWSSFLDGQRSFLHNLFSRAVKATETSPQL
jgi:hypothetical protein